MNSEQSEHVKRTLADLDARLGRITAEVAEIRTGLSALGGLTAPAPVPGSSSAREAAPGAPSPAPAPAPAAGQPGQGQQPGPAHQPGPTQQPWQHQYQQQRSGPAPAQPSGPWRAGGPVLQQPGQQGPSFPVHGQPAPAKPSRLTPATIIAALGGAIMLAGIAFLLVVAIQAGLFPPIARVIGAGILAVVLVGLGLWLQSRHKPTEDRPVNPGALALVGTGLAAGVLDVIASSTLYGWIPDIAAYMLVGGMALGGMILAHHWRSAVLAGLVAAGTMALAPLISHGVELPIFYVIVGIATAVLAGGLGLVVRLIWSVPPAFMLTGYLTTSDTRLLGDQIALIVGALAFAAVTLVVAWYDSARRSPIAEYGALVVVPGAVPLLVLPTLDLLDPGWPTGLLVAAAYLVLAVFFARAVVPGAALTGNDPSMTGAPADGTPDVGGTTPATGAPTPRAALIGDDARRNAELLLAAVTGCVGSVLLVAAWGALDGPATTGLAITLTAIAYALAAGRWGRGWLEWVAGIIAGLAVFVYLGVNQPFLALSERAAVGEFTYIDVVASFAIAVLAVVVTVWFRRRFPDAGSRAVMIGAVVVLLALSVMIVAAGVVIGDLAGGSRNGFLAAHLVVTVLWICCAAWLVLTASPRVADARKLGFVLGALALAKLLLLDLATLPGLFRVLSFIVVGAVMLAVAVRYRGGGDDDNPTPAGPSPFAGAGAGPGGPGASAGQPAGAWTPQGQPMGQGAAGQHGPVSQQPFSQPKGAWTPQSQQTGAWTPQSQQSQQSGAWAPQGQQPGAGNPQEWRPAADP
ncbi:DUF2339 domain-containing protein [Dietzia aerolata]|uniref:DUF2339 domain-containing protein n=2 Tax=Dietzia aerolata TaxID=595984 RepID=A0ABV5JXH3_9ACTN